MTIIPQGDKFVFRVLSDSGEEYRVDLEESACDCRDYQYRRQSKSGLERLCKHLRFTLLTVGPMIIRTLINEQNERNKPETPF